MRSDEFDRLVGQVDDSIFEFMKTHPTHELTARLIPQIRENLARYGEPFMQIGARNERSEAAEAAIDALNKEKSNGI